MKNLMVFIHHSKRFKKVDKYRDVGLFARLQIDNSLSWGWRPEDIMLVTNFPFEYHGIKSIVVSDNCFKAKQRTVSKINAILELYERGLIDDLMWFHDLDAFQNDPIPWLNLNGKLLALTHSSVGDSRFSTGVMFFSLGARSLFQQIRDRCYRDNINEEVALRSLIKENKSIKQNIMVLEIGHNFAIRKRDVVKNYGEADKPIKVLHFIPTDPRLCSHAKDQTSLEVAFPLMSDRLKEVFLRHSIL